MEIRKPKRYNAGLHVLGDQTEAVFIMFCTFSSPHNELDHRNKCGAIEKIEKLLAMLRDLLSPYVEIKWLQKSDAMLRRICLKKCSLLWFHTYWKRGRVQEFCVVCGSAV